MQTHPTEHLASRTLLVDECWSGGWQGQTTLTVDSTGIHLATDADPAPTMHLRGGAFPGFTDAHVHLGLTDPPALRQGGIASVHDLGWRPDDIAGWMEDPAFPKIRYAGAFLAAPGGYPSDRGWAPDGSVVQVADADEARIAVDRQLGHGASFIKITLNSAAGPVFDDITLRAIVGHSHVRGKEVVAHVEGPGQAARAFEAGVDRLAHAPWTERLPDELLSAMAGPRARTLSGMQTWVSTLDIHGRGELTQEFVTARDNLRRFYAYGGHVLYGTDLGNGPMPVGVNEREVQALVSAGISEAGVVRAMTPHQFGSAISFVPGKPGEEISTWFAGATVYTADTLLDPNFTSEYAS